LLAPPLHRAGVGDTAIITIVYLNLDIASIITWGAKGHWENNSVTMGVRDLWVRRC
jgi:hypothetical protein